MSFKLALPSSNPEDLIYVLFPLSVAKMTFDVEKSRSTTSFLFYNKTKPLELSELCIGLSNQRSRVQNPGVAGSISDFSPSSHHCDVPYLGEWIALWLQNFAPKPKTRVRIMVSAGLIFGLFFLITIDDTTFNVEK